MTKRYFTIGSEWLYYKLYMGSKTSEDFLINVLEPNAETLIKDGLIDKWFFINFNDPGRHIRVRFHLMEKPGNFEKLVLRINELLAPYVSDRVLHEVMAGTYKRELERYGTHTIEEFETLFFLNSKLIVKMLSLCVDDQEKRWLFGMKAIDHILNDWQVDDFSKKDFFESLKTSFAAEMGATSAILKQLSNKYRANRKQIESYMTEEPPELAELLSEHSEASRPTIDSILRKKQDQFLSNTVVDVLESYTHMHFNRLFSSKQRMNEWVLYDFLHQYYRSKIARDKQKIKKV